MPFENPQRVTRRRSSAGPVPPRRPLNQGSDLHGANRLGGPRPTFLTLRDHGKVYVADLPSLSDGQLAHISKEAEEVLESLERRITDLEQEGGTSTANSADRDTFIKASTKRDVTRRFLRAIEDEQEYRQNNPALQGAASESLPRTFLEVARHRLPGSTFDSLLREALEACSKEDSSNNEEAEATEESAKPSKPPQPVPPVKVVPLRSSASSSTKTTTTMPVVVSPEPTFTKPTRA